jgi:hypothetical protein
LAEWVGLVVDRRHGDAVGNVIITEGDAHCQFVPSRGRQMPWEPAVARGEAGAGVAPSAR